MEEMDRFLDNFNLPRLNQEEIEIMNNTIISTEIEAVILLKNFAHFLHMAVFQDPTNAASVKGSSGLFPGLYESFSFLPS